MFAKLAALALLSTAAIAVPTGLEPRDDPYVWYVTGYTSTCTAATCYYGFNVSAPAGPSGEPSFDAYGCIGSSIPSTFKACSTVGIDVPGNVEAEEENLGRDVGGNVFVKLSWKTDGVSYTLTGNETVPHTNGGNPILFNIYPNAITAVPDKA